MLKHIMRIFVLALLATATAGCLADKAEHHPMHDRSEVQSRSGVSLNLHQYRVSDGGILNIGAELSNNSTDNICVGPNTDNTLQVNIVDATTGLRVFAQDEEIGLDPNAVSDADEASHAYYGPPIKIASSGNVVISKTLEPLVGAYLVDSRNVGVERSVSSAGLLVEVELPVFECSFPNLNGALLAGRHTIVRSETVEIQGSVGTFLK